MLGLSSTATFAILSAALLVVLIVALKAIDPTSDTALLVGLLGSVLLSSGITAHVAGTAHQNKADIQEVKNQAGVGGQDSEQNTPG